MKSAVAFGLLAAIIANAQEIGISGPYADGVRLDWQAVPSKTYNIMTTPDLTSSWTTATPSGVLISNVLGSYNTPATNSTQFFRVLKQDTDAPSVDSLIPFNGAVAIPTNASVFVSISDETGIDTNSLLVSIGPWQDMTASSPYLSFSNGLLSFSPPSSLGTDGEVITNRLTISDTLGHALSDYTWTFELNRQAIATNAFLPLLAPPSAPPGKSGIRRTLPGVRPLSGQDDLHIISVTTNTVLFSYSGTPPTISNGTLLVSFDAANPFYRKVTSSQTDTDLQRITAWTEDVPITELLTAGSFSSVDLTPANEPSGSRPLANISLNLLHIEFGDDLSGTVLFEDSGLKLHLPTADWAFTGDIDIYADITAKQLRAFDAVAEGSLILHLSPEAIFDRASSGANVFPLTSPTRKIFGGMAGPIPIWVEVVMELNAGYEYSASIHGDAHTMLSTTNELTFSVSYRDGQWTRNADKSLTWSADPITWQINGSATAKFYVQPKLTIMAYSLAGLWADIVPYAEFDGNYQLNPLEYDLGLYFGLSSTLGITSRIPGIPEPEWNLFDQRWPLWSDVYPPTAGQPAFTAAFPNKMVSEGASITLTGFATGRPDPSYRWFFNGVLVRGALAPEYHVESAQMGHAGIYTVEAYNSAGAASTSCTVSVGGLVAYYPLNNDAVDISGNGHDGTISGALGAPNRFNQANKCLSFDGVDDYISLPASTLNHLPQGTLCGWLYQENLNAQYAILYGGLNLGVGGNPKRLTFATANDAGVALYFISDNTFQLNTWQHIAATWDGSRWAIYVNGRLDKSTTTQIVPRTINSSGAWIGWHGQGGEYLRGKVDDIRIYNRALSAGEIWNIYQSGNL